MARTAQDWKLVWRHGIAAVRFQIQGKRHAVSTLQRDPVQAEKVAARIYQEAISGRVTVESGATRGEGS
jgi:6-phosphofructokinase